MPENTAVIIDDEKPGRDHLSALLRRVCPEVEIVGTAENVTTGVGMIRDTRPDIVFLDISMPGESGFDVLDQIGERDFALIFVTAHDEYALQAIKSRTVDYLLKPLDIDDLTAAVEKAKEYLSKYRNNLVSPQARAGEALSIGDRTVSIPTASGLRILRIKDIVYLKARDNYTFIHLVNGTSGMLLSKNLGQMEKELPESIFFRSHKSFLINLLCLTEYRRESDDPLVMANGDQVKLARRKKGKLHAILNNRQS